MSFVFISYSHKDSAFANRLADSLEAKGLDVWIDEQIQYGARWSQEIQERLDRCAAFVVVMTNDSLESVWVQNELLYAISRGKPILPVRLEGPIWMTVAATQVAYATESSLPPTSFYRRVTDVLSAGENQRASSTGKGERLQTELDELQQRYDNLSRRIAAVDTDLGREPDSERRLMLEDRRAELASLRDKCNARLVQLEHGLKDAELAQQIGAGSNRPIEIKPSPVAPARGKRPAPSMWTGSGYSMLGSARSSLQQPHNLLSVTDPIRMDLLRVPAGEFLMGSDPTNDGSAEEDEQPQHPVHLAEFYMGKYPVTNKQYAVFVQSTKWRAPRFWAGGKYPQNLENHPVVGVSLHDAQEFCEWLSDAKALHFRIPSEAEWEKAARGTDGRIYPWEHGHSVGLTLANYLGSQIGSTTPVGRYERGVSAYGALDMAGNVWEWTRNLWGKDSVKPAFTYPYDPTDGREPLRIEEHMHCVVRGGSYDSPAPHLRCAFRDHLNPMRMHENVGFRVSITHPQ